MESGEKKQSEYSHFRCERLIETSVSEVSIG